MTTLTKRGEPRQGTMLDVQLIDDSWLTVTVVGKAYTTDGRLARICVEADGGRDWVPWGGADGVVWRPAGNESTDG